MCIPLASCAIACLLGATAPLAGQQPRVSVVPSGQKLDILFGDRVRLSGGQPSFQAGTLSIDGLKGRGGGFVFQGGSAPITVLVRMSDHAPVVSFFLSPNGNQSPDGREFLGFLFERIPDFQKGVSIWRYGPWKCWTKPVAVNALRDIKDWDVQLFYWRYADGVYGAAIPLSGNGYRTTLGQEKGKFGSKSLSYFDGMARDSIPQMAIGFGKDPFQLFESLYEEGLALLGRSENLRKNKSFPSVLENIGWCTWNASGLGKNLNEELLLSAAKEFSRNGFPVRWFLVDDGWFDHTGNKLNSLTPNREKFPRGFSSIIRILKEEYHLKDVGVWHALNGYWQGINPNSELGSKYRGDLISWQEHIRPDQASTDVRTCAFISPYSKALDEFYRGFHEYLRDEGFSFVKVDNQLIIERMAPGNFPIWEGAERYHAALHRSVEKTFNNVIINCMDMTADAYLNFGTTAIARGVEDYFPYEKGESYDLQRGNAAAHLVQAIYNSLYFSQIVFSDFDHFESTNPNAVFHAIARGLNNGPIYITDAVGEHRFDVLTPLVYSDGKIIRSDKPLFPAEDCLFQVQDPSPFKAYSLAGNTGLLGVWNCADAGSVEGFCSASDVHGLRGEEFAVYEYFSKELTIAGKDRKIPVRLDRFGYRLYYFAPLTEGNAVLGLVNKYNAPATLLKSTVSAKSIDATLYEGGRFAAVAATAPRSVKVDGKETPFTYAGKLLSVDIPVGGERKDVRVEILFE